MEKLSLISDSEFIILCFLDLIGMLRGKTIPARVVSEVIVDGVGFDASSIPGFAEIWESDMIMKPDLSTLVRFPDYFYNYKVGGIICNIYVPEGFPFKYDGRQICIRMEEKFKSQGLQPLAGAEPEFYLVKTNGETIFPVENHIHDNHRYLDVSPGRDLTEQYRMDLSATLITMGFNVEKHHHEVGHSQNEIVLKFSSVTENADRILWYKMIAKTIALKKYNWVATFMPKPWIEKPGNGLHIHLSLKSVNNGENIFADTNDNYAGISQICRYFIGGLLEHSRALSAIVASTVNSYKRLIPGFEAPVYISWGKRNRSALIRVPEKHLKKPSEIRIEYRCPDPLCNPYLMYTAIFEAGMDGIKKKIDPGDPINECIYHLSDEKRRELGIKTLPSSLKEALEEWYSDDICIKAFGKDVAEKYYELKMEEWKEYIKQNSNPKPDEITKWEIYKYLYM
ncbi:MAG: type I glutamate--ammonia ligase [Candidatus Methanomethylicia archaeon]